MVPYSNPCGSLRTPWHINGSSSSSFETPKSHGSHGLSSYFQIRAVHCIWRQTHTSQFLLVIPHYIPMNCLVYICICNIIYYHAYTYTSAQNSPSFRLLFYWFSKVEFPIPHPHFHPKKTSQPALEGWIHAPFLDHEISWTPHFTCESWCFLRPKKPWGALAKSNGEGTGEAFGWSPGRGALCGSLGDVASSAGDWFSQVFGVRRCGFWDLHEMLRRILLPSGYVKIAIENGHRNS